MAVKRWLLLLPVVLQSTVGKHDKTRKHNVLQRCQMNTEPWPQITHVKNMVKFERVVFDLRLRNDKHRHVHGWIAVWIALHSSGTNAEKSSG